MSCHVLVLQYYRVRTLHRDTAAILCAVCVTSVCVESVEKVAGGKIIVRVNLVVANPQTLTELQYNTFPKTNLSRRAIGRPSYVYLRVAIYAVSPHPHLETPFDRFHGHVLFYG